jgi:hypothetical protein
VLKRRRPSCTRCLAAWALVPDLERLFLHSPGGIALVIRIIASEMTVLVKPELYVTAGVYEFLVFAHVGRSVVLEV